MAEFPAPADGIVLTHFIVSKDVERSRRFYTKVLGGELVLAGEPSIVQLSNGWVIINPSAPLFSAKLLLAITWRVALADAPAKTGTRPWTWSIVSRTTS